MTHMPSLTTSVPTLFRASWPVCVSAGERFPMTTNHPLCGGTSDGGPIAATSSGLRLGVGRPSFCSGAGRVAPRPAPWNTCDRCRVSEIPPACPSHVCVPRCGCRIALFDPRKGNAGQNSHAIAPMGREVWGTTERAVDRYAALSTRPFVTRSVWDRPVSTCYSPGRTDGRVEGRPSENTIAVCGPREISQKGNRR